MVLAFCLLKNNNSKYLQNAELQWYKDSLLKAVKQQQVLLFNRTQMKTAQLLEPPPSGSLVCSTLFLFVILQFFSY